MDEIVGHTEGVSETFGLPAFDCLSARIECSEPATHIILDRNGIPPATQKHKEVDTSGVSALVLIDCRVSDLRHITKVVVFWQLFKRHFVYLERVLMILFFKSQFKSYTKHFYIYCNWCFLECLQVFFTLAHGLVSLMSNRKYAVKDRVKMFIKSTYPSIFFTGSSLHISVIQCFSSSFSSSSWTPNRYILPFCLI